MVQKRVVPFKQRVDESHAADSVLYDIFTAWRANLLLPSLSLFARSLSLEGAVHRALSMSFLLCSSANRVKVEQKRRENQEALMLSKQLVTYYRGVSANRTSLWICTQKELTFWRAKQLHKESGAYAGCLGSTARRRMLIWDVGALSVVVSGSPNERWKGVSSCRDMCFCA